jgi:hypothetical protein
MCAAAQASRVRAGPRTLHPRRRCGAPASAGGILRRGRPSHQARPLIARRPWHAPERHHSYSSYRPHSPPPQPPTTSVTSALTPIADRRPPSTHMAAPAAPRSSRTPRVPPCAPLQLQEASRSGLLRRCTLRCSHVAKDGVPIQRVARRAAVRGSTGARGASTRGGEEGQTANRRAASVAAWVAPRLVVAGLFHQVVGVHDAAEAPQVIKHLHRVLCLADAVTKHTRLFGEGELVELGQPWRAR